MSSQRRWPEPVLLLMRAAATGRGRVGLVLAGLVIMIAFAGPFLRDGSPTALLGSPFGTASGAPLGLDYLGRDVLARILHGGVVLLPLAAAGTALGVLLGALLGITAGFAGGLYDEVVMRLLDVILAIPQIILALLLLSVAGSSPPLLVVAVTLIHAPQVARVARASTLTVAEDAYVRYSRSLGAKPLRIALTDILPNISSPLLVESALRLTYSVGILASLNFLGFGNRPPAADWGSMINDNRAGIEQTPWPVVVPVVLIAVLTIGINLFADAVSRVAIGVGGASSASVVAVAPTVALGAENTPGDLALSTRTPTRKGEL